MSDQNALRTRLCAIIQDYGSTVTYIAKTTKIDQSQLNKFKLGKLYLEPAQAQRLDHFLIERGYSSEAKALAAIVQGSFND